MKATIAALIGIAVGLAIGLAANHKPHQNIESLTGELFAINTNHNDSVARIITERKQHPIAQMLYQVRKGESSTRWTERELTSALFVVSVNEALQSTNFAAQSASDLK